MSALVWDKVGERRYEAGVSRGVLYDENGSGVAWSGLTSIEEGSQNEVEPVYFDGVKINDIVTVGELTGTIRAFTYPDEFLQFEGILEEQRGFYVTSQAPRRFGLSYRTEIDGDKSGYKLHLLYNLTAIPASKNYKTLSLDVEPMEFEWSVTSIPEDLDYYQPTAHVIFDSTRINPNLLIDLEAVLYGDETHEAHLPSLKGLSSFIRKWQRLIVTDNNDGTWVASSDVPGVITMLNDYTFQIVSDTATFIDSDSYTITSTEKNEEDL